MIKKTYLTITLRDSYNNNIIHKYYIFIKDNKYLPYIITKFTDQAIIGDLILLHMGKYYDKYSINDNTEDSINNIHKIRGYLIVRNKLHKDFNEDMVYYLHNINAPNPIRIAINEDFDHE